MSALETSTSATFQGTKLLLNYGIPGHSNKPIRGARRGSVADRLLGLRVRNQPEAQMSVSCECCVVCLRRADPSSRGFLQTVVCICELEES